MCPRPNVAGDGEPPEAPGLEVASYECFAVVDGVEAAPYPWVRGDLHFTLDGTLLSCVAATPDDRFRDAGDIPAGASDPSAGVRLVLESPKRDKSYSPGRTMQPIKLVLVEEQITAD